MRTAHRKGRSLSVALWALVGCGPTISEVRTASAPAREPNCPLEFIQVDMNELSSGAGQWEMLGQVVLQEDGVQDPFAERYRALVRPRACAMGGEAVSIVMSATSQGLTTSGSATNYGVLRKRTGQPSAPKSF
jgi:hypothetical protein